MIPDPRETPTLTVEDAGRLLRLGRSAAYEQARRWIVTNGAEGLPCLQFGRTLRVPTQKLVEMLGFGPQRDEAPPAPAAPVIPLADQGQEVRRGSA